MRRFWALVLRLSRLSRVQKWSCAASGACYLAGYFLLAYIKPFEFLREHVVLFSLGCFIGWPIMLVILKVCNSIESKVREGASFRFRVGFLILQLVLMILFNVSATILSLHIKGELGIWTCSLMLASISLMEVMLMEDNDYGMAEMVLAILLGATSSMVTTQLILYPVAALCCLRKVAVFGMKEFSFLDDMPNNRNFINYMKKKVLSLKIQWNQVRNDIGYNKHDERFARFTEMGATLDHVSNAIRNLHGEATRNVSGGEQVQID